jgi:hypothetical protein
MPEPVVLKPILYVMASEPTSTAHFKNPSHQSVCLYVARKRLGENVTSATNVHATIEELLDTSFYMLSLSYHKEAGD